MWKKLIIVLLLINSYTICSQNTINVKKTTLVKIHKDLEICDSLKVAYKSQTKQLEELIQFSLINVSEIEKTILERNNAIDKVEEINKQLSKNKKNTIPKILGGVSVGLIIGILIN